MNLTALNVESMCGIKGSPTCFLVTFQSQTDSKWLPVDIWNIIGHIETHRGGRQPERHEDLLLLNLLNLQLILNLANL